MNILDSIIDKWNKNKDVESLLSEELFSDQTAIQSSLDKLSGSQKEYALKQIGEIELAINAYIAEITQEKTEVKKQLDNTLKSAKACLSYGSSIDTQNKS